MISVNRIVYFILIVISTDLFANHLNNAYFTNYLEGEKIGLKITEIVANPANTVYLIIDIKNNASPEMFVARWITPDGTVYDLGLGASYISSRMKSCYFFLGCSEDMPTGKWQVEIYYDKNKEKTVELNVLPNDASNK